MLFVAGWSAIDNIHILNVQHTILNSVQSHSRQADGIRLPGRTCRKEATRLRIHERHDVQLESLAAVEMVQQDHMGEPIEIL